MTEFLPLGSVVTLQQGTKRLMIVGRLQQQVDSNTVYDYAAVLWPQGVVDSQHFYLFNQEDIQTLFYIGLQDIQEFNYRFVLEEESQKKSA